MAMLQLNFTPFPVLHTKRLQLRSVEIDDAGEIFFLRSDKKLLKYLDREPAKTLKDAADFVERIQNDQKNNDGIL